jgi:hypothetical protein
MMCKTRAMASGLTTGLLLLLDVIHGTVAAQTSAEPQSTSAPPPHGVIPVAAVAAQATEVTTLLRTLRAQVVPSPAIDTIHRVLPEASGTIGLELAATSTMLQVKSDLTTAVYEAVCAAGLSFPFPQREVRVRREAEGTPAPVNAAQNSARADT